MQDQYKFIYLAILQRYYVDVTICEAKNLENIYNSLLAQNVVGTNVTVLENEYNV